MASGSAQSAGAASGAMVASGSRVIVVVSRGQSPTPPAAHVEVPPILGMPQGDALGLLQETGFSAQVFNDYSATVARGTVMGQMPHAGTSVPAGSEAVLLVSSGPPLTDAALVRLIDVIGLPEAEAVSRLQSGGLSPQIVREYSDDVPLGAVIAQLPSSASLADIPAEKPSLTWLWITLVVLVLVAAGIGGYLWFNRTGVVPDVVGLSQSEAVSAIEAAGFKVGSVGTTQTISASEVGKVTTQTPPPNGSVRIGSSVDVVVSGGQKLMDVPNVVGKTQAEAEAAVRDAGLTSQVTPNFSASVPKGSVIQQAPSAGQRVPAGTSIGLTVSEGVQNVAVPSVTGQTQTQAQAALKAAGLGAQLVDNLSNAAPKDQVMAQYPTAGTSVAPGVIVGLVVSAGPPASTAASATVPSVVGKTSSSAQTSIKNVGMTAVTVQWSGSTQPAGTVVAQIPDAGLLVPKGSSVMIFVSTGK